MAILYSLKPFDCFRNNHANFTIDENDVIYCGEKIHSGRGIDKCVDNPQHVEPLINPY